jgi:hypothetical protein
MDLFSCKRSGAWAVPMAVNRSHKARIARRRKRWMDSVTQDLSDAEWIACRGVGWWLHMPMVASGALKGLPEESLWRSIAG